MIPDAKPRRPGARHPAGRPASSIRGCLAIGALFFLALSGCAGADTPAQTPAPPESPSATRVPSLTPTASSTATASPVPSATPTATITPNPTATPIPEGRVLYTTRSGDILSALATRFGTEAGMIQCARANEPLCKLPESAEANAARVMLPAGLQLVIPEPAGETGPAGLLIPDSELIYSAAAADFDTHAYVAAAEGYLAGHTQWLKLNGWNSAADIIAMVATENSINPQLLLALLEYQCKCLLGTPADPASIEPFLGATSQQYLRSDLYGQLDWAVNQLSAGYYGWRHGSLTEIELKDGTRVRLAPQLNAGTAAVQYVFGQLYGQEEWLQAIDPQTGWPALYQELFGDPWERELLIYPAQVSQPELELPFAPGKTWAYTGGPHPAFEGNGPLASLDFAPSQAEQGCLPTDTWVAAVADGPVVRSAFGLVIQDLDGDGLEQTGWNIMYLHIDDQDRVEEGVYLQKGDPVGSPSCAGGIATGTHLHIARKYNGEWIPADSALPFNLSGWIALNGDMVYLGYLVRDGVVLEACVCSWENSWIRLDE